jgi:glycosyltransferase involved in cell wall biosynthesis
MSQPLLTAAMIVRDEEEHLAACLESLLPVVDELLVADTGSRDGSAEIAERFGARVIRLPWAGDFAAARNAVLDQVRGRYVLYIDADEWLRPVARSQIEDLLGQDRAAGFTVRFRPARGHTRYREHRLWRSDPRIRFAGVIHESMVEALYAVAASDGLTVQPSDLELDHCGYEGDQSTKHRRNLPLLSARLAQDPGHAYSWDHLGRVLAALGRTDEALAAWRCGLEAVRRKPTPQGGDSFAYLALIAHEGTARGRTPLLEEALRLFPGDHAVRYHWGRALLAEGAYEDAIAIFEALAGTDPECLCEAQVAYDVRLFRELAFEALGLGYFRLGRFAASADWYARAQACRPDEPAYRVKRRLAEARAAAAERPS